MPDPTPEHLASLARVLDPANIKSRGYLAITPHEAAKALYAAVRTDPEVQDAMLAALAEGGRLVEEQHVNSVTVDVGDGATCVSEGCVWWPGSHGHVRVTHRRRVEPWREVPQ